MLPENIQPWLSGALALGEDAHFVTDAAGVVTMVNDAARNLLGASTADPVGKPLSESFELSDQAAGKVLVATEIPENAPATALLTQQGQISYLVQIHRRAVRAAGQTLGHVIRIEDMSAVKRARDKDRVEKEESERAQAREAVNIFMGGVGNQLRNGLQIITGHAEMIADGVASEKARRLSASAIRKQSQRVFALITRMLDFAQTKSSEMVELDLADAVIEASPSMRAGLPENVHLVTSLNVASCPVRIDAKGIETALHVLVDNARDAMPKGGTITVSVDEIKGSDAFSLRVADTGTGIAPDVRLHLFEPFFTTRKNEGAAGLGLSQLSDLVKAAGGKIEVSSELGSGSEFKVILPRAGTRLPGERRISRTTAALPPATEARVSGRTSVPATPAVLASAGSSSGPIDLEAVLRPAPAAPPPRAPVPAPAPERRPLSFKKPVAVPPPPQQSFVLPDGPTKPIDPANTTVLVVDDEDDLLFLTSDRLRAEGFNVLTAELGPVALAMFRENRDQIDLVVTDVFMPGMKGPDMVREIWASKPNMKVIYMTGDPDSVAGPPDQRRSILQKPFPMSTFSAAVRAALSS